MGADQRQPQSRGPLFLSHAKRNGESCRAPARQRRKVLGSPVTAIVAYDLKFYEKQPKLPAQSEDAPVVADSPQLVETTARRNSSLQGA
jgi:hypothetical protein